jgi:hypothetical protein
VAWASASVIAEQTSVTKPDDAGPSVGAAPAVPALATAAVDATAEDATAEDAAAEVAAVDDALAAENAGPIVAGPLVSTAEAAGVAVGVPFSRAADPP